MTLYIVHRFPESVAAKINAQTTLPSTLLRELLIFFSTAPSHPLRPALSPPQIDFEDQKIGNIGNDCLMSIKGTNFWIPQTGEAKTGDTFATHKYAFKSALRYEIGVSIIGGPSMDPGSLPSWTLH